MRRLPVLQSLLLQNLLACYALGASAGAGACRWAELE